MVIRTKYLIRTAVAAAILVGIVGIALAAPWIRAGFDGGPANSLDSYSCSSINILSTWGAAIQPTAQDALNYDLNANVDWTTVASVGFQAYAIEKDSQELDPGNLGVLLNDTSTPVSTYATTRYNLQPTALETDIGFTAWYSSVQLQWNFPNTLDDNIEFAVTYVINFNNGNQRDPEIFGFVPDITSNGSCPDAQVSLPDNRLNPDPQATGVVYCIADQIVVYGVNAQSQGFVSLVVSEEEVEEVGVPSSNTLLAEGPSAYAGTIRLYRLSSGEFQVNAPGANEEYVFIWNGCG